MTQCRGEEIMRRGGGSPPARQLAELIWVSCHWGKLRQTKVPVQKQETTKRKQKKARKGTKKYRNTTFIRPRTCLSKLFFPSFSPAATRSPCPTTVRCSPSSPRPPPTWWASGARCTATLFPPSTSRIQQKWRAWHGPTWFVSTKWNSFQKRWWLCKKTPKVSEKPRIFCSRAAPIIVQGKKDRRIKSGSHLANNAWKEKANVGKLGLAYIFLCDVRDANFSILYQFFIDHYNIVIFNDLHLYVVFQFQC